MKNTTTSYLRSIGCERDYCPAHAKLAKEVAR